MRMMMFVKARNDRNEAEEGGGALAIGKKANLEEEGEEEVAEQKIMLVRVVPKVEWTPVVGEEGGDDVNNDMHATMGWVRKEEEMKVLMRN
ncbi:hypothetical protein COCNU_scaffold032126G000010 [Cocos nucifera]|nr:hypothetical protein [Cocos nucifera]